MGMNSCLYEGAVQHHRYEPVDHRFQYRLFQVFLDLEELPTLFRGRWFWSATGPNLAWFRRSDHLGSVDQPLNLCVLDLVEKRLGFRPSGPIRLLTNLRYFGFSMNPVSFFYCYDSDAATVVAVVAEVNNTPWNERHCYVLDTRQQLAAGTKARWLPDRQPKVFHVSPFLGMDMEYAWYLTRPEDHLEIAIQNWTDHGKIFDSQLMLKRTELTSASLARVLIQYPVMTIRVFAAIYWQALRLWLKRVPYVPHPGPASGTTD